MGVLNVRLNADLEHRLVHEAEQAGKPRSEVAREAIERHVAQLERERFDAALVKAAKSIANDPALRREAQVMAGDFLDAENEALASSDAACEQDVSEHTPALRRWR